MKSDIAITTVSWIRTNEEAEIVIAAIKYLNQLNLPIIIADAGSPQKEKDLIKSLPNIVFFENSNGLTAQLIQSHQEAAKHADYLFYLQTDKLDFIQNSVMMMINKYRKLTKKGLLIPTRTDNSRATYPKYQTANEDFLNFMMSDYIGITKDYYAGPKIYPAHLVKYLAKIKWDIGWGIEAFFYALAKRSGLPFEFTDVYLKAPSDIGDVNKIKEYRLKITAWQINGLIEGNNLPL